MVGTVVANRSMGRFDREKLEAPFFKSEIKWAGLYIVYSRGRRMRLCHCESKPKTYTRGDGVHVDREFNQKFGFIIALNLGNVCRRDANQDVAMIRVYTCELMLIRSLLNFTLLDRIEYVYTDR
jgi:hypothetical protein